MRLEGLTWAESEHVSNTHTILCPAGYIIGASILTIWGLITNIRPCAYTNNSAICLYISNKCQILSLHAGFHLWNWQVQAIIGHRLSIGCSKSTSPSRRVTFTSSPSPKPPRSRSKTTSYLHCSSKHSACFGILLSNGQPIPPWGAVLHKSAYPV